MEEYKYITFDNDDIIEALEDLYAKRNKERIDIRFDNTNVISLKPLRSITVKKTISSPISSIIDNGQVVSLPVEGVSYQLGYSELGYGEQNAKTGWTSAILQTTSVSNNTLSSKL